MRAGRNAPASGPGACARPGRSPRRAWSAPWRSPVDTTKPRRNSSTRSRSIRIASTRTITTRRASFASGEIARSADLFRKAGEVRTDDFQSPMLLGQSLRMIGRRAEGAGSVARRAPSRRARPRAQPEGLPGAVALDGSSLRRRSDGARARMVGTEPGSLSRRHGHPDQRRLPAHANGPQGRGLDLLERVFAKGWGKRDWVEHDPDYDLLRDEPRFKKLLANLK